MVKIRLMRVGKRKQPSFRVVVADSRSPRDGRIIEAIGRYQPRDEPSLVSIDVDRALYWLQRGAQPSDQVRQLLRISGAWSQFTGEAPPEPLAPKAKKATKAASVKATPAESVDAGDDEATPQEAEEPAAPEAGATADGEGEEEAEA